MMAIALFARSIDTVLTDDTGQNSIEFALVVFLLTLGTVAALYVLSGTITGTWFGLSTNTPTTF